MLTIKSIAGGAGYAAYLSNNDYYSEGEKVQGEWMGQGATLLNLQGEVKLEHFDAVRLCHHPVTGEFLRERESADRYKTVEREGEMQKEKVASGVAMYDFTLSAPKDLSIMAMVDPRLSESHDVGVRAAFAAMEGLSGAGVRNDGPNRIRRTSNLIAARYDHDTSRALDPQLHSHFVVTNMTYDAVAAKWKALDSFELYKHVDFITEVYRNAVAADVHSKGYATVNLSLDGKDNGFGFAGITPAIREKFSQRSQEKKAAVDAFIEANGRVPSNDEVSRLVHDIRDPKMKESTTAEVRAGIMSRFDQEELETITGLREAALVRGDTREYAPAAASLAYATEHIFERNSVARDYEIQTEALVHGRGRINPAELAGELQAEIATGHMLTARGRVGNNIATEASLERERRMVATVNEGLGKYEPLGRDRAFVPSERLRTEQRVSLLAVLGSTDFVFNIQGAAGVGKTTLLEDVNRGLTDARQSVLPVAPTAAAVDELRKVGFSGAITIAQLLVDVQKQHELSGQVLLIDEAGAVGSKDFEEILAIAEKMGARVLTAGDTRQAKSVSEGDALRVLEQESNLKSTSLVEVQRQSNLEYRAAVQALRTNPAKGYELLEKMGAIREVNWQLIGKETSNAYREALAVSNREGKRRSVLVVAATHYQIRSITHAVRSDRKAAGELGESQTIAKHTAVNWTKAQREQMHRYQPGQVLVFHKAVQGVAKNEALEVVSADKRGVTARNSRGDEITITRRQAQAFGVFQKEEIEVAAGDKLLLQSNRRDKGFRATNGQLVTVESVTDGVIKLDDGRELPKTYRQFTHGYAVTAQVSQGQTVDFVINVTDKMREDLAYVAMTRGKEGLTILTSDKVALEVSLGVSGDRQSAMELARQVGSIKPVDSVPAEELLAVYTAQQEAQEMSRKPAQQEQFEHKKEEKQYVHDRVTERVNERSHSVGMGL